MDVRHLCGASVLEIKVLVRFPIRKSENEIAAILHPMRRQDGEVNRDSMLVIGVFGVEHYRIPQHSECSN